MSTESGADLPKELADKHHVQVVPMHVIMNGQDYLDGTLPVMDIPRRHVLTQNRVP